MDPTEEQEAALELFGLGDPLVIEAGAGAGKTSTLELLARSTQRSGTYVAFNRKIVQDGAGRFPMNIQCSTVHSLAYRAVVDDRLRARLNGHRMRSSQLAGLLELERVVVELPGREPKVLSAGFLAGLVMRAITTFCQSDAPAPAGWHVPVVRGIETESGSTVNNDRLREILVPYLHRAWTDLQDPDGKLPFRPDHYLAMWALREPRIPGDFVLVDEAQDIDPRMMQAVTHSAAATGQQIVWVGDSQQCQPAGTMVLRVAAPGAGKRATVVEEVPIEQVRVGDRVVSYDIGKRHMFVRGQAVTEVARRRYSGWLVSAKSALGRSRYTPEHRCVVNPAGLDGRFVVYLMRKGDRYRVGCCQWRYGSQGGQAGFVVRARQEGADAVWVLDTFESRRDALVAEFATAGRFGLPTITFAPVHAGSVLDAAALEEGWSAIGPGLRHRAETCLSAFGREHDHPIWRAGERFRARRTGVVVAANLLSGMAMLGADGSTWSPIVVDREPFVGTVHSLAVAGSETYVADGMVTHNSIYQWRGAVNALERIEGAHRTFLTRSFRFGPAIAEAANLLLEQLGAELRLSGCDRPSRLAAVGVPDAVLHRSNAAAVATFMRLRNQGRAVHLVGGADDVVRFARAAQQLKDGRATEHPDLACFDSWNEVLDYVADDPQGDELALIVKLLEDFGIQIVVDALDGMIAEDSADVLVSTAHKAKGREWPKVRLGGDFPAELITEEENRLAYVAVTRAQDVLDPFACAPYMIAAQERIPG